MNGDNVVRLAVRPRPPGGGGPSDGMSDRVTRLEARLDEIGRRLDGIDHNLSSLDDKLGRLPSRDFLATTVIAVGGISLAAALAFAALTFNIADYASKNGQQLEQTKATQTPQPAQPQPIIVVVPASTPAAPQSASPIQQKPSSQP